MRNNARRPGRPGRRQQGAGASVTEINWLGEDRCHDPARVGAKAAHLSRLASLHLVPPGFAMSAVPADEPLPDELVTRIRAAYRQLAALTRQPAPPVAVRSSAIDEDSAGASFAGQHATFLNVRGGDAVIAAVAACCASALDASALDYRARQGLASEHPAVAVLVQLLVESEASAVVFSANPITSDRGQVVVNVSWGLGESVVGGTVTPDFFVIDRRTLGVVQQSISDKAVMTVLTEAGTAEVAVPDDLRTRSSVTSSQLIEMARLAAKLEDAMGWPVDVECAVAYDELYLLQCRPITTLRD